MIKHSINFVTESFSEEGYELLDNVYINSRSKLRTLCPNGHLYDVSFDKWLSGSRCLCSKNKNRITIDYIVDIFSARGYKVLSKTYVNGDKIDYMCHEGHIHSIRLDHFVNGHGCPYCAGRPIITTDVVKEEFLKENYELLSEYINSGEKLFYICPNGHTNSITWGNWKTGYRCPECANNVKKDIDFIKDEVSKFGCSVVDDNYINNKNRIHLICPNGHDYFVSWDNWNHSGSRCPKCKDWGSSEQEKSLIEFVKSLGLYFIEHDRNLIAPYELDIVIPDKKIAIEYCGLYWHSEIAGKTKKYHIDKLKLCEAKGYRLITIFEDELIFNKDLVFSRLKNILGLGADYRIYARKCKIVSVSLKDASDFCNKNHIQGYGSVAVVRIGLEYNGSLVSVMTFSKPSIAKGSCNIDGFWELHRFCSLKDTIVVGASSRLLEHFKRNNKWIRIYSYADRRWSCGDVYSKVGFTLEGNTAPNYWYIKNQRRVHRYGLRKTQEDSKNITEWELRKSQGWNRIWDCGNIRYSISKE